MSNPLSVRAVLFDMDGVIVSTQSQHARSETLALKECGVDLAPEEITRRYAGYVDKALFADALRAHGKDHSPKAVETVVARKWKIADELFEKEGIALIPGAMPWIEGFYKAGLPLAVASSSPMSFIDLVVKKCSLEKYFRALTSGHEVEHGKPAPDIFLLAASRLGVEPGECLVIEDAKSGMQGAKSAGMRCLGLWPKASGECPADLTVETFVGLDPMEILKSLLIK